jgi:hypothetical protein
VERKKEKKNKDEQTNKKDERPGAASGGDAKQEAGALVISRAAGVPVVGGLPRHPRTGKETAAKRAKGVGDTTRSCCNRASTTVAKTPQGCRQT